VLEGGQTGMAILYAAPLVSKALGRRRRRS